MHSTGRHYLTFIFLLTFLMLTGIASLPAQNMKKQLLEVKEASYYDSLKLFTIGEETIKMAKERSDDCAIAEVHIYYGNYFVYIERLKQAKDLFEKSLEEAMACKNRHLEILARIRLAYLLNATGQMDAGRKIYDQLLKEATAEGDNENVCEILNLKGIDLEGQNKEKEAVQLYLQGISIAEENNLTYYPGVFLNNLGLIKNSTGQTEEALKDFFKGLEIASKYNHKRLASHIQMNICLSYIALKKPEKALLIFNSVIAYSRRYNLPLELASNYINLSSALLNTGKEESGLNYIDSAIQVFSKFGMKKQLTMGYLSKTNALLQLGKINGLENLQERTKALVDSTHDLEDLSSYYFMQYRINSVKKNYAQALDDYVKYNKLRDSLNENMNAKVIAELQQNQKVQQKEIELEKERSKALLLEKTAQDERFQKWVSISAGILAILLLASVLYFRYNRKIKEKQAQFSRQLIENIEDERNRISRDLHDDIGQSLSVIKSKVIKEKESIPETGEKLEQELSRVIEQTREISRNLFPTHLEKIGLARAVANLLESVQNATGMECSFEIDDSIENIPLSARTHLFRIIQECINNTIKHSGASGLKLTIQKKEDEFQLLYMDNGHGIKKKDLLGIGMQSMKERAKIIGSQLEIDEKSEKGFRLMLKFKG